MEETKNTGIPITGEITLECSIEQLELYSKNLVKELSFTGIVVRSNDGNKKARVTIVLKTILNPRIYIHETFLNVEKSGLLPEQDEVALEKAHRFFSKEFNKNMWVMAGYFAGKSKHTPVVIIYYENVKYGVYSILKENAELLKYFPDGIPSVDPKAN